MGKGDKKTKKGKISIGSYGVSRNKKAIKARLKRGRVKPAAAPVVVTVPVEIKPKAKRAPRKKASASE